MGLFDFFKKKPDPAAGDVQKENLSKENVSGSNVPKGNVLKEEPAGRQVGTPEEEKIRLLDRLFTIPTEQRDQQWQEIVEAHIADTPFRAGEPKVVLGPDSFPYFVLHLPQPGEPYEKLTLRQIKDDFLLEKGFGVVIDPKGKGVEWVFTYGDVVNFHLTGQFFSPKRAPAPDEEVIKEDEEVLVAQPAESYLPLQTRAVLRQHLMAHGIKDPKIFLMVRHQGDREVQELAFNLSRDQFPTREHQAKLMQRLGWFLPRHYSIISFATNNTGLEKNFMPL